MPRSICVTCLFITAGCLLHISSVQAQSISDWKAITTGKWMYDLNPSPFVQLYKMEFFLNDQGERTPFSEVLKSQKIDLDSMPFATIFFKNQEYLAVKRKNSGDPRLFKILKKGSDYLLLCDDEKEICDCKSGTFIYYIPESRLQRIQKPFSFSMKRNLTDRLNEWDIPLPSGWEKMGYGDALNALVR